MPSHGAILLCGGRSSRMGRAKAWLPWRGRTLLEQVASVLRQAVDEIVVVASEALEPPALPRAARLVRDERPEQGPLAGLAAGLAALEADAAFAIGTDVPFLTPAFVRRVLAGAGAQEAIAPVLDGFVQPLGAAYPKRGAAVARDLLAAGRRRPLDLLDALGFERLGEAELPDRVSLRGLDTPGEYLAAVAGDGQSSAVTLALSGRALSLAGRARLEVPIGTLAEVIARVPGGSSVCVGLQVAPEFRVVLGGREPVRDTWIPVGPGERVEVADAEP